METILRYDWPGNARELRNAIERSIVLASGDEIRGEDLPEEVHGGCVALAARGGDAAFLNEPDFREAKRKFEAEYLSRRLKAHQWNVSKTADEIGLHRQSLQEKLRELGIKRPGKE